MRSVLGLVLLLLPLASGWADEAGKLEWSRDSALAWLALIDNGEIERVLKKPSIGRRNFLHCGSAKGAKRLCAAYTLVLSAKALGLDVQAYLTDVINKLAAGWPLRQIRQLVPDAWAAARAAEQASE